MTAKKDSTGPSTEGPFSLPEPLDPNWERFSQRPFPPYRFIPKRTPHPRRDPRGYAYGQPEPKAIALPPQQWRDIELYLYGIDLYNYAYWWECHEALEALWHAVGHNTPQGQFLQGLIQISAAHLKRFVGSVEVARDLAGKGLSRFAGLPDTYMGVSLRSFEQEVRRSFEDPEGRPVLIRLGL